MQTSKRVGEKILFASLIAFGIGTLPVFAEDIGVESTSQPRTSRVRTVNRPKPPAAKPVSRPAAVRPTLPRPIQDETTPAASTPVAPPVSRPVAVPVAAPAAPTARRPAPREESVNLDALTTTPTRASGHSSGAMPSMAGLNPHGSSGILPNFKFYFDFLTKSWKGSATESDFTFDTFHQRMLVEYTPTPDLMFQADILRLSYFEMDYMLSSRLQLRWGRIWIPFDDMSPHSIFGGRINTQEFFQGNETAFLPNIWADLGVGLKYTLADSAGYSSNLHFYVVNGFQMGTGTSPAAGDNAALPYPSFAGTSGDTGDNNNDKAIGARWHNIFGRRVGLGVSIYRDNYTNKGLKPEAIAMLGTDLQLRPTNTTEIRLGYVQMKVSLDETLATKGSFTRSGTYVELGQRFGAEDRWKFLIRAGASQNDNRVVDVSDKTIVGGTLLRNFGTVEGQLTFFKDLHQVESKRAYNFGALRIVTAF